MTVFFAGFLGAFMASAAWDIWKWWRSEYDVKKKENNARRND